MYGGFGSWLYSSVGGIGRRYGSRGWTDLVINPTVGASSNVTSATASIDTPIGQAAVEWTSQVSNTGTCGYVAENSVLNLRCVGSNGQPGANTC